MTKNKKPLKAAIPTLESAPTELEETLASQTSEEASTPANKVSPDLKLELAKEIYELLKAGDTVPGYSLLPAGKAEINPTVDVVMAKFGSTCVCKMKKGLEEKYITSARHKRGVIRGEEAKSIEVFGFDYDA